MKYLLFLAWLFFSFFGANDTIFSNTHLQLLPDHLYEWLNKSFALRRLLLKGLDTVMQIFRFSANFANFVAKKVIFVNRLNPLRQFRGVWEGVGGAQCIFRLFL